VSGIKVVQNIFEEMITYTRQRAEGFDDSSSAAV
jgi:hypothetical protein